MFNIIDAQKAYDLAMSKLDAIDISDEMNAAMKHIGEAAELGGIATWTDGMELLKAEKLSIELENLGYTCTVGPLNSTVDGKRQYAIALNWKFITRNTRERLN